MTGDFLDLILIVVIAAFAVAGYRQGFIIGVLSLVGFVAGVSLGAYIAPGLTRSLASNASEQAFVAILVVFVVAVIGMLIASGVGVAVRSRLRGRQVTRFDSLGGAAVNIVAVAIVAWLIGTLAAGSSAFPAVARQVKNSAVLRTVDAVMPHSALYLPMFPELRTLLGHGLYTQVFNALGAYSGQGLAAPDPAVLNNSALRQDEASIVKVTGTATTCSLAIEGSGFVISPQHILTNAHVVAGVNSDQEVTTAAGRRFPARVVLYDPERDLAVLDVPGLGAPPLRFAGPAKSGAEAIVAGYPLSHPFTAIAARVGSAFNATGADIYQTGSVTRQIYDVRANRILPGNSGGPLLSASGQVYGVVFAASTYYQQTGYALTGAEVASDVAAGVNATAPVSTQACQGG